MGIMLELLILILLCCNLLLLLRIDSKLPRRDRAQEAYERAKKKYEMD
ncbi:hypothetical protein M5X00_19485 [Paenibacillus alvei]|nr:hypothetical protein [Paenibacillus alvei]EJW19572.1 hypothetical protein PAV_1c05530 [Paenibacillus alvei DSM 29]MCY7485603.1 hypothetical protein [Paenibacillus alvei]MCY9541391.1 hypothetical protein [Paenibacillus alvei]MCY9702702.1 hypothetical protein [Paenibacillus alvei]MCY9733086.1 hypothetical protein [Paenibacillus alvei]